MSYGPPPGPSEPAGPPPPGGDYGPPSSYGSPPSTGSTFDPKSVDPLDWVAVAAGVLALIFSFFAFYTYDAKGAPSQGCSRLSEIPASVRGTIGALCDGDSYSAWNGFFGWFGVLLAVIGAVLVAGAVFAPQLTLPVPMRLAHRRGLAALGFDLRAARPVRHPGLARAVSDRHHRQRRTTRRHRRAAAGFSWYIVLALALVGAVLSHSCGSSRPAACCRDAAAAGATPGQPADRSVSPAGTGYGRRQRVRRPPQQTPPHRPRRSSTASRRRVRRRGTSRARRRVRRPGYAAADRRRAASRPPPGYQQPPPGYQQPPPGYQQPPPGYNPPQQ